MIIVLWFIHDLYDYIITTWTIILGTLHEFKWALIFVIKKHISMDSQNNWFKTMYAYGFIKQFTLVSMAIKIKFLNSLLLSSNFKKFHFWNNGSIDFVHC